MLKKKIAQKKKNTIIILTFSLFILIFSGFFFFKKDLFKTEPKQIYEVEIMVRSQKNPNKEEDRKTSLKRGDVLLVKPENTKWSRGEKISYLILKMKLTKEQVSKLTKPKTKTLSKKEIEKRLNERIKNLPQKIQDKEKEMLRKELENEQEILIAREYAIDLDKYFPDFKATDLLNGQPYQDKIYDWKIVKRKK